MTVLLAVSWGELQDHARTLAGLVAARGPWRGLVAVSRGGLVPAAIVSYELDIRLIETMCIASYQDRTQGQLQVLKGLSGTGTGWLVVDDLVDSGRTAEVVRRMLPEAHYATLYAKPAGRAWVDSFVTEVAQDQWLVFPWDQPATVAPNGRT